MLIVKTSLNGCDGGWPRFQKLQLLVSYMTLAAHLGFFQNHVDIAFTRPVGDKSILTCHRFRYGSLAEIAEHREINSWNCWTSESFADAADASATRSISEMLRQTSPKAASGSTGFAMLPSAHDMYPYLTHIPRVLGPTPNGSLKIH